MPDDLYQADILRWSAQQAALLRRLARGERVNDAIDWENVAEEVESLGRSELASVESLLQRAMEHLLKAHAWPAGPVAKWRGETMTFLLAARRRYVPSMAQAIDLDALYADAATIVSVTSYRSRPPGGVPAVCPFRLSALIVAQPGRPDIDGLLNALTRAAR